MDWDPLGFGSGIGSAISNSVSGLGSMFAGSTPDTKTEDSGFSMPWGDIFSAGATAIGGYLVNENNNEQANERARMQNDAALAQINAQGANSLEAIRLKEMLDASAKASVEAAQIAAAAQKEIANRRNLVEAYKAAIENAQSSGVNKSTSYQRIPGMVRGFGG